MTISHCLAYCPIRTKTNFFCTFLARKPHYLVSFLLPLTVPSTAAKTFCNKIGNMEKEKNLFVRLIRASQGLAYWSKEFLQVKKAIEKKASAPQRKQGQAKGAMK